ncbi:MAG: minor capsid protein [Bacteroidales bacterium]|nr:minor capsid protein [Bacteroidales bacterium]
MNNLLIHSCTYEAPAASDRDGNINYGLPVELQRVRVVMELATVRTNEGEAKNDVGTLYYSPFESSPQIIPEELARVTWQGKAYTIRKVYPCYTQNGDTVHHYEAALV